MSSLISLVGQKVSEEEALAISDCMKVRAFLFTEFLSVITWKCFSLQISRVGGVLVSQFIVMRGVNMIMCLLVNVSVTEKSMQHIQYSV